MRFWFRALGWLLLVLCSCVLFPTCGSTPAPSCVRGATQPCLCPDLRKGVQTCSQDTQGPYWSSCVCPSTSQERSNENTGQDGTPVLEPSPGIEPSAEASSSEPVVDSSPEPLADAVSDAGINPEPGSDASGETTPPEQSASEPPPGDNNVGPESGPEPGPDVVSCVASSPRQIQPKTHTNIVHNPRAGIDARPYQIANHPVITNGYLRARVNYGNHYTPPGTTLWKDVNPAKNKYDFKVFDEALQEVSSHNANKAAKVEDVMTLALRLLVSDIGIEGFPAWIVQEGGKTKQVTCGSRTFKVPDWSDPVFLKWHRTFLLAWAKYLRSHPLRHRISYIDIGSVGLSGEWHYYCSGNSSQFVHLPDVQASKKVIDQYFEAFKPTGTTPHFELVAVMGMRNISTGRTTPYELMDYAVCKKKGGAGWRQDCFGDCGFFAEYCKMMSWSTSNNSCLHNAWKKHPVAFEVCGVIRDWDTTHPQKKIGYCGTPKGCNFVVNTLDEVMDAGLDKFHMTYFHTLSTAINNWPNTPTSKAVLKMQTRIGYRLAITEVSHVPQIGVGANLTLKVKLKNLGVAPNYDTYAKYQLTAHINGRKKSIPFGAIMPQQTITLTLPFGSFSQPTGKIHVEWSAQQLVQGKAFTLELANVGEAGQHPNHRYRFSQVEVLSCP